MAFGTGELISTLAFEMMDHEYKHGGIGAAAAGIFTGLNMWLAAHDARHQKRSQQQQPSEANNPGSGMAIALGALLDGIPESVVIGVSLLQGITVSYAAVTAIFLSNIPEGLSSVAGMKNAGRSAAYIFIVWGSITLLLGFTAMIGYLCFRNALPQVISVVDALAAGVILAMLVDTMIPEAYEVAHNYVGLITVLGFLLAFTLSKFSSS